MGTKIEIDKDVAEDMLHTFEILINSIGKPTNEYHWRSFAGHAKALEDAGVKNIYREKMMAITCECGSTDIESRKTFKRTGPPKNPPASNRGKRMSYGYAFIRHTCNKCENSWEGEKVKL